MKSENQKMYEARAKMMEARQKAKMSFKEKLKKQLDHWFYKDSDAFKEEIRMEQLAKAAEKYNEPFDPADWTPEQLVRHAMQENYDQQNYIYGLYLKIQEFEKNEHAVIENCELRKEIERLKRDKSFWYGKCQELNKLILKDKYKG